MNYKKNTHIVFLLLLAGSSFFFSARQRINIVFIGDSITQGEKETVAPPFFAAAFLERRVGHGKLRFSNQGVSGCTTVDFLPSTATHFLDVAKAADSFYTDKEASLIFSIMLGTNDSAIDGPLGSPVSPSSYSDNIREIIDKLLTSYPAAKIIIHYPLWYSPNTYNKSKYLQEGLTRLQTYLPAIDAVVKKYSQTNPGHVFAGDKLAFGFFKQNHLNLMKPEKGQQGTFYLHPNIKGSQELARFWSNAISKIVQQFK